MRFLDNNINLKINNLKFKAYLESSDHIFEPIDQKIPFVPTSFRNDSIAIRIMEKVKFQFNVFSETRFECIRNYRNLRNLLFQIKPQFVEIEDLYIPAKKNLEGFINLSFIGMPNRNSATIHLTGFSYSVNKEIGYLEVTNSEIQTGKFTQYFDSNMKLIPLAYSISIEGKIIQPFKDTVTIGERGVTYSQLKDEGQEYANAYRNLANDKEKFNAWFETVSAYRLEDYTQNDQAKIVAEFNKIKNELNANGKPSSRNSKNLKKIRDATAAIDILEKELAGSKAVN